MAPTPGTSRRGGINLTRLGYSTSVPLASNPVIALTRTQIFEAVWDMDSDSYQSPAFFIAKYTCPKCGGIISIHDKECSE